jgi:hypothetical protein
LKNLLFPLALRKNKKVSCQGSFGVVEELLFCSLTCHEATLEKQEQAGGPQFPGTSYGQLILLGSSPGKLWIPYPARFFTRQVYNSAAKAASEVLLLM